MRSTIEFCGISSLILLLVSAVGVMIATIWDADFYAKISATGMVVSGAVFAMALVAAASPLYKD